MVIVNWVVDVVLVCLKYTLLNINKHLTTQHANIYNLLIVYICYLIAHGSDELRSGDRSQEYKSLPCYQCTLHNQHCPYDNEHGLRCNYTHVVCDV